MKPNINWPPKIVFLYFKDTVVLFGATLCFGMDTHTLTHTHTHIYIYIYIYIYVYAYIHTRINKHTHTHTSAHVCIRTHTHKRNTLYKQLCVESYRGFHFVCQFFISRRIIHRQIRIIRHVDNRELDRG
jgi:hypothetical protein